MEALEKPDAHFCLGVQWHPEWLSDADPAQQGLFGAFVEACKGYVSRACAGSVFSFGQMALRSAQARGRAVFFFKLVLALVARGWFFFRSSGLRSARARGRGVFRLPPPYLWTPLPQRVKGFSPLTIPKMRSKRKKASRCAKRFFLVSPICCFAADFTPLLNVKSCESVTPSAEP